MRDDLCHGVQPKETLDPRLQLALSVGVPLRVGVGGGEGDASELLDPPLTHAKSQPNLLLMASDAARRKIPIQAPILRSYCNIKVILATRVCPVNVFLVCCPGLAFKCGKY